MREVQRNVLLFLAHGRRRIEPMLPDAAAERPREERCLEGRHADVAVELRAPWRLVVLDQEPQDAAADLVPRRRSLPAAPVRAVVRKPSTPVELLAVERIFELELEHHADVFPSRDGL